MSVIIFSSCVLPFKPPLGSTTPRLHLCRPRYQQWSIGHCSSTSFRLPLISFSRSRDHQYPFRATVPSDEGTVAVINFEDFVEKDWSFLDTERTESDEEHNQKISQIISAGKIEKSSRVLISIGSEEFVDRVVDSSPCEQLLVVHDSLFALACIKEKYDKVKCWQGELIYVPEKWAPFNVVFLYFLPALPFELDQVLGALAKHCLPGARLVISHPQGRQVAEAQREQYPDVVVSGLPDKTILQTVGAENSFEMVEYVDEPSFYLAILVFKSN